MIDELNNQKLVPEDVIKERVSDVDQNPQLLMSEDESSVFPESETHLINDLQKYDSVEDGNDGYHVICSEDVAEPNGFLSVSKEDSQVDSLDEVGVLIVSPTEKDVVSDQSSGGSLEVEEKVYNGGEGNRSKAIGRKAKRLGLFEADGDS
ncbi:hypothetical protein RYX36_018771 [Vicia faba]